MVQLWKVFTAKYTCDQLSMIHIHEKFLAELNSVQTQDELLYVSIHECMHVLCS